MKTIKKKLEVAALPAKTSRPSWHQFYYNLLKDVSLRSTCMRHQYACIITRNNRVLTMGYNGALAGYPNCDVNGCLKNHCLNIPGCHETCVALHAEQNAILQATKNDIDISRSTVYISASPCIICLKLLVGADVEHIFYVEEHKDPAIYKMLANQHKHSPYPEQDEFYKYFAFMNTFFHKIFIDDGKVVKIT